MREDLPRRDIFGQRELNKKGLDEVWALLLSLFVFGQFAAVPVFWNDHHNHRHRSHHLWFQGLCWVFYVHYIKTLKMLFW